MTNARQSNDQSQAVVSIVKEIEAYNDAVLQMELKNKEYHPKTYAYLNTKHRS